MHKGISLTAAAICLVGGAALATHQWGNYHWERSQNPLVKSLGNNLSGPWPNHFFSAVADWNNSAVLELTPRTGGAKNLRRCSPKSGEIEVCNEAYGLNGWLGIAGISVSGDHITSGYAKLNDSYFGSAPYDTAAWRQSVMCQEIGHLWGLGHNDEDFSTTTGTCMDYSSDPTDNQHPDAHDYAMLEEIYAHLDGAGPGDGGDGGGSCNPRSPKCNSGSGAGDVAARVLAELSMDGPRQWGQRVSEHGPAETFELDLGNGNRIITVVRWTMERANGRHDDH